MKGDPFVFDVEGDGLYWHIKEIHCIVADNLRTGRVFKFYDKDLPGLERDRDTFYLGDFDKLVQNAGELIGHNIIGYDYAVLQKLLGISVPEDCKTIDTLVWSKVLNPDRQLPKGCPTSVFNPVTGENDKITPHSVAAWGYRVGQIKPAIYDWRTFTPEILHRCVEDVGIQKKIYYELLKEKDNVRAF